MRPDDVALAIGLVGLIAAPILLGCFLWYAATLGAFFAARGRERWRAWVPVVGEVELFRMAERPPWIVALLFVPLVCVYALVERARVLARVGDPVGMGTGLAIIGAIVPPIWTTVAASRAKLLRGTDPARPDASLPHGLEDTGEPTDGREQRTAPPKARKQVERGPKRVTRRTPQPSPGPAVPSAAPALAVPNGPSVPPIASAAPAAAVPAQYEIIVRGGDRYPLLGDRVIVGRAPTGTERDTLYLALPDQTRTLSKRHAELRRAGDLWFVQDLGSTNGVAVSIGGTAPVRIPPGKRIQLTGPFRLGEVDVHIRPLAD